MVQKNSREVLLKKLFSLEQLRKYNWTGGYLRIILNHKKATMSKTYYDPADLKNLVTLLNGMKNWGQNSLIITEKFLKKVRYRQGKIPYSTCCFPCGTMSLLHRCLYQRWTAAWN